jgi:hypothetical protein
MQPETYMAFSVDRQGVALVADFTMNEWPAAGEPPDSFVHYSYLHDLERVGRSYTCRLIGYMTIAMMQYTDPATMRRHPVGDVTPAGLVNPDGSATVMVDPTAPMGTHVMLSLDVGAQALEIVERGRDKRIMPGTVRMVPVADLAQRGGDVAAIDIGAIVLNVLMSLYPSVFAPYPALA